MMIWLGGPAWLRYSDDMPEQFGGLTRGPVITIRPKYADRETGHWDEGLHQHEAKHVEQWWTLWLLCVAIGGALTVGLDWPLEYALGGVIAGIAAHPLLYRFVHDYRWFAEAAAYREQCSLPDRRGNRLSKLQAADWMRSEYGLNISPVEALASLE